VWGFIALLVGIAAGGMIPEALEPVADATRSLLSVIVLLAPALIVGALSPAIATLVRRGLAGRFVAAVIGWFVLASVVGSMLGMVVAGIAFHLPLEGGAATLGDAATMLRSLASGGKASGAVVAVMVAVVIGLIGVKADRVYEVLRGIERGIAMAGSWIGIAMVPLILALGIMIGVSFGARIGMSHYGLMILYSAVMAVIWWLLYWLLALPLLGGVRDRVRLLKDYYLPTALFAAGTCSTLATIPVNIANVKKYGVRDEVADFVIPMGAILHKGASAMQYMAYGPLIAGYVFGLEIGWSHLLVVWPFIVVYTMAAPGVPGAMGLALWTAVLFASLLGLQDPLRATFVGTWVALAGGIPDMFRTSGNSTADGFAAIIFDHHFDQRFKGVAPVPDTVSHPTRSKPMPTAISAARSLVAVLVVLALSAHAAVAQLSASLASQATAINASTDPLLRSFRWRSIGPSDQGGRVDDIAVVEGDPRTYYVGYATGGVWKTVNGGTTFESVFDTYRTSHIGAIAIAQSDPNIVWVGTGEANNRNSSSYGDGIYKSTDGGKTFTEMGLRGTQSIHRIVIDPRNPNIVFVAAVGALYGPNPERGVYRTSDAGRTWKRVLFVDENTGANEVVIDPSDSNIIFASMYERRRAAWGFNGGGPGSGIWKSTDGGSNWTRLTGNGLPSGQMGRIALDVSRSQPNIVYAQIEVLRDEDRVVGGAVPRNRSLRRDAVVGDYVGGVWRSDDKGRTWQFRSNHNVRPSYFSKLRIDPQNPDVVYTAGRRFYRSTDGGRSFAVVSGPGHADHHAIWIDPHDSDHFMVGNDGGFDVTRDRGRTFEAMRPAAVGQFYQVSVDMRRPYFVCGGLQDNSSWCGPSAVGARFISAYDWYNVGRGDGGYTAVDPTDHDVVYAEGQRGTIRRLDMSINEVTPIQPRLGTAQLSSNIIPRPADGESLRWNWTTPFILSPHDPSTIYIGANRLFKSVDRGDTWTMSPDLTRNLNRDTLSILGVKGILPDCHADGKLAKSQACILSKNDGTWFFSTITTLAESPIVPGVLWVGTDDGNVQVSQRGLHDWTNVTANVSGSPRGCWISRVEASHADASTAYLSIDCHRNNDMHPYVYVTRDLGKSWKSISSDLPEFGCVNVIKEDPRNPKLLYVGTENGFYVSLDTGNSWKRLMTGLPPVRVDDIVVHPRDGDLILATHGRSVLVMDDITPLQQLQPGVLASDVHLFVPRNALILRDEQRLMRVQAGSKQFRGTNPEPGAVFHYYLANRANGPVKLTVRDALTGKVVRTLDGSAEPGINRVRWDMMGDAVPSTSEVAQSPSRRLGAGTYRVTLTVNGAEQSHDFLVEEAK
jgi:Na+/H+-dicarboxylate symporter/photosystem II stability/assembly factor-like uncharacterized protein